MDQENDQSEFSEALGFPEEKSNVESKGAEPDQEVEEKTEQNDANTNQSDSEPETTAPEAEEKKESEGKSDNESFLLTSSTQIPLRTFIALSLQADLSGKPPVTNLASLLIEARQTESSSRFQAKNESQQSAINSGSDSVKKTFQNIKSTIGHMSPELLGTEPIDWDFWSRVAENYDAVVQEDPELLLQMVARGIPKEFRGIIWQLVAKSKNLQLEELYLQMKNEASVHEKAIKRDLTRTSFFTNVDAVKKADELFNVIKAYSLFDPDVGYTQGMVFIAVPLVMNMSEAECFSLLVTLMKDYGLRDLFCPEMQGLHLLLHQFDRVLESQLPALFNHLIRQGVKLLMYASQWFLTFFSYKFPLDVVLRIFDMVITQGIEVILQLAINLMLQNEENLLLLKFDHLLEFLKLNLFNVYVSDDFVESPEKETRRFSLLGRKQQGNPKNYYKLDAFVTDALLVKIVPADLTRYKQEFESLCEKDAARLHDIERLKVENGSLRHEIKEVESQYYKLSQSHIKVVQQLVDIKMRLPDMRNDVEETRSTVNELQTDIKALEEKLKSNPQGLSEDTETRIQELLAENAKETERFSNLEEKMSQLTIENNKLTAELKQSHGQKWFW